MGGVSLSGLYKRSRAIGSGRVGISIALYKAALCIVGGIMPPASVGVKLKGNGIEPAVSLRTVFVEPLAAEVGKLLAVLRKPAVSQGIVD